MLSNKVQLTVNLCVVSSLVDGVASDEEFIATVNKISERYPEEPAQAICDSAQNLLEIYQTDDLSNNRGKAVLLAVTALRDLHRDEENSQAEALKIAREVMEADGTDEKEAQFIHLLSRLLGYL
jgi:tellurite resistance protein